MTGLLGFGRGSELERMLENDMSSVARLGVLEAAGAGAGALAGSGFKIDDMETADVDIGRDGGSCAGRDREGDDVRLRALFVGLPGSAL